MAMRKPGATGNKKMARQMSVSLATLRARGVDGCVPRRRGANWSRLGRAALRRPE